MTVVNFPGTKTAEGRVSDSSRVIRQAIAEVMRAARRGEVSAVAICWVGTDGMTQHRWEAPFEEPILMAAITYLQHDYASAQIEAASTPEPDRGGHG